MIVVGGGRVGSVFARGGATVVRRGQPIPDAREPIVVCTRADDLAGVITATPVEAREQLCFVQNGVIAPLLHRFGLEANTQGLLWFAATGGGEVRTGRPSLFRGPHAPELVAQLAGLGVPARVCEEGWEAQVAEKLLWLCIFGLLGDRWDETVGRSAHRGAEVRALVHELAPIFDLELDLDGITERLCAYSASIPDFRAALREPRWRNGWLIQKARAREIPTPWHDAAMRALGQAP